MSHTRTVPSMEELSSQRASWLMTRPVTLSLCPLKRRTIRTASTSYLHQGCHFVNPYSQGHSLMISHKACKA